MDLQKAITDGLFSILLLLTVLPAVMVVLTLNIVRSACWLLISLSAAAGLFFFLAGTVGLLRFPDTLTRLHALTKADNLGLGLVVLGLMPHVAGVLPALKLIAIWLLVLLCGADASQLIARAARRRDPPA